MTDNNKERPSQGRAGGGGVAAPVPPASSNNNAEEVDDDEEEEGYSVDHLSAVIRPVALTMILARCVWRVALWHTRALVRKVYATRVHSRARVRARYHAFCFRPPRI